MTDVDQGWMIDDGPDEDDTWDDDPFGDVEPDEPDWGDDGPWRELVGRDKRRNARFWRQYYRRQRKVWRHRNDRPWLARNRSAFDDAAPF